MSNNTFSNTSNQNRLYIGLINSLKILQFLGYFIAIIYSFFIYSIFSFNLAVNGAFAVSLISVVIGCIFVYIVTQSLIAIIDLLSRIERNTRVE